MTGRVWVVETAVSDFGPHEGHGLVACAATSVTAVLGRLSGQAASIVDGVWLGCARPGESAGWESGLAVRVAQAAGLPGVPGTDVRAFCASGNLAVIQATAELRSGRGALAVAAGVEHMSSYRTRGPLRPVAVPDWAGDLGPVSFYGLAAARYLHEHGLEPAALAEVSVRNRAFGVTNPHARFRSEVTVDEVLGSRAIADPLTLLQCSAPADGSGAALLANEEGLERLGLEPAGLVEVAGTGHAAAADAPRVDLLSYAEDRHAARQAYEEAGIGSGDLAVAEIHDAFSIAQAIHLEDLGIAERGDGWRSPRTGLTVNPSGGLLARGHPLGATGLAQVDAVVRHLATGECGLIQEAGGIQHLGQMLSTAIVMKREVVV